MFWHEPRNRYRDSRNHLKGKQMKNKVLIIEDNDYKYFTTKQILTSQLKLVVEVQGVHSAKELVEATDGINPNQIIFRPSGGVAELLMKLKRRKINRRNTEILLICAADMDPDVVDRAQEFIKGFQRVAAAA